MNKPQRKSSVGRDSLHGRFRSSSSFAGSRNTPLLKSSSRPPLSAAKTNQRESYIGTTNQHAVKDPRPLTEKVYMKRCILEILQILSSLNYPNSLTPKMFSPPSTKEYQRVFEFLSFEVMGAFRIMGKPDEEMLKALKDMMYPYNISKSTLNNIGAMSCWPQALGALKWIADLARYSQGLDDAIEESLSMNTRKKLKHEFNSRCYSEFMHGNDGPYTELKSQLKEAVDELDVDAEKEMDKKHTEYAKLSAAYNQKVQEKASFDALAEEIETKQSNIRKIKQYLSQCDDYINEMKYRATETQDAIRVQEEQLRSSNDTLIQLKSQVSQQDFNRVDIEQLIRDKQQLRDSLNAATDRLKQLKNSKWELEVQIGKLFAKGNELAESFNAQFKSASKSLLMIKNHLPSQLIDELNAKQFTLLCGHKGLENGTLLTNEIEPFLTSLNNKMLEVLGSLESEYYNSRKRVKQDGEILSDFNKEKEQLQEQLQKLVKEGEIQDEELKKAQESLNLQISNNEKTLEQLKCTHSESLEEWIERVKEAKEKTRQITEKHNSEVASEEQSLAKLKHSVKAFQETLHARVEKLLLRMDGVDEESRKRLSDVKASVAELEIDLTDIKKQSKPSTSSSS